jgi:hypothetical protein
MSSNFSYQYPGDPVGTCSKLTRKEFKELYPDRKITISVGGLDTSTVYEMKPDEIYCDSCNDDPKEVIYLTHKPERAYYQKCADKWILPYANQG